MCSVESKKYKFSKYELRSLQLKSLDLVLKFKKFCDENNLKWFLCGGGCIGAVRHGGFIPWDDDLDVFMFREDYEKLYSISKKGNLNFYVIRTSEEVFSGQTFISVTDKETTVIKKEQLGLNIPRGVSIDIFPLDASPSSKFKQNLQMMSACLFCLYTARVVSKNNGFFAYIMSVILLAIVPFDKLRFKLASFFEKQMSKYDLNKCSFVKELCAGPKYMTKLYSKKIFEKCEMKSFEGYDLPIPAGYDEYLKSAFGDYMSLPPQNERINSHDIVFIDLNNSSDKYKYRF